MPDPQPSRAASLKAYKVACRDDDHGVEIVFANRAKDVCKFSNENCDCEFLDRTVHREPRFDKYAPGPVTTRHFLAEGWQVPCAQCEDLLYEDNLPLVSDDDRAYCDIECVERSLKFWREHGPNVHESVRDAALAAERLLITKGQTA